MNNTPQAYSTADLSVTESRLLRELIEAMRDIRYGSILLTIHDGRVVEVLKTKKIRMPASSEAT
ncbi:MAG TPA: YezD family protein [Terracidiphilus sp.]|nr:YezD family protein [Terracidiphilus sp.]